jgi:chemotaxis protein CheC
MSGSSGVELDEMETDALTELVNLGVSRSAVNLRTMIGHEILLSVPSIALVSRDQTARIIGGPENTKLVAVRQVFEGDFSGRAMLIFPETNSLALVQAVTGGTVALEDIMGLEQEALAETGNVILNSFLATVANLLRRNLRMSLPEIVRGEGPDLFELSAETDARVLLIYINFSVDAHDIRGYIAMMMDVPGLRVLKSLLAELIGRYAGGEPSASHAAP